jgi:hypothetical protein
LTLLRFFGLRRGALVVGLLSRVVDSDGSVGRSRGGVGDLGGWFFSGLVVAD